MHPTTDFPDYQGDATQGSRRAIDILEDARNLGRRNLPRSDERAPSGAQKLIVDHFRAERRDLDRRARSSLSDLLRRCANVDDVPSPDDLAALWADAELRIQRIKLEGRDALVRYERAERRVFRHRAWFRRHHRISGEAEYPNSAWLQVGILSGLIVVESVANMYFFAQGSELGLLGGLIQALLVSLGNVGLAVAVGFFCLRNLHHVSALRRGLGGLGFGTYLGLALLLNLAVGHYRDMYAVDPAGALLATLPAMRLDPLALSPHSMLLLGLGLLAATIGLAKGYTLDDRYPGHGRIERRYRVVESEYAAFVAEARAKVMDVIAGTHSACEALLSQARASLSEDERRLREIEETPARHAAASEALETECHRQLRSFREENQLVRTTQPPSYYDHYPPLEGSFPVAALEEPRERQEERRMRGQKLEASAADYRARTVKRLELEMQGFDSYLQQINEQVHTELQGEG